MTSTRHRGRVGGPATTAEVSLVYAAMELAKNHPELALLVLEANATVAFLSGSTKKVWMEQCARVWDEVKNDTKIKEFRRRSR